MMKYLPLLLVLLVTSCMYSNDDVYISPIKPPENSNAAINLNIQEGTIVIHENTDFTFSVSPAGKGTYQAIILADNQEIYNWTSDQEQFYFRLSPGVVGSGEKTLTIRVRYSSKSQSLAGQLGTESLVVTRSWQLIVDITPPAALAAPEVYLEDGKSMLRWEEPNRFSFSELILVRTYRKPDGTFQYRDSIKFEDHHTTAHHDSRYTGGRIIYSIDIKGYKYYVKGAEREFNVTPLTFTRDVMATQPVLSWNKSPLYGNDIVIDLNGVTYPIDQPGSVQASPRFGMPAHYTFAILPKYAGAHRNEVQASISRGLRLPAFETIAYLPTPNVYLLANRTKLYKIAAGTLDTLQTYSLPIDGYQYFVSSANGEHVYLMYDDKLQHIDITTLTIDETIDISQLTGQANQGFGSIPSVSNNNLVAFNLMARAIVYVIDLNTKQVLWQQSGVFRAPVISPDSEFLYWRGSVYSNRASNWSTLAGTISAAGSATNERFIPTAPHELIVYTTSGNNAYGYNLDVAPDGNGVFNPAYSFANSLLTDPASGQFYRKHYYASYVGRADILDADRTTVTRTLDDIQDPDQFIYLNNHFFHRYGHYLP